VSERNAKRPSQHALDAAHLLVRDLIRPDSITSTGVEAMAIAVVLLESERNEMLTELKALKEWAGSLGVRIGQKEQREGLAIFKRVNALIAKAEGRS
jgi:hypothetical protein